MNWGMDQYDRNARLKPALLVLLPITLTIIALAPDEVIGWSGVIAAIIQAGGSFLLAQIVGDIGKSKEPKLFASFGGRPTDTLLSHQRAGNRQVLAERHRRLGALLPNVRIPSAEDELKDPDAAADTYALCVDRLRAIARTDKLKYIDVHRENIHYGFRRNLWALKPIGVGLSAVAAIIIGAITYGLASTHSQVSPLLPIAFVVNASLFVCWILVITRKWVERAAGLYANRLLEVIDQQS